MSCCISCNCNIGTENLTIIGADLDRISTRFQIGRVCYCLTVHLNDYIRQLDRCYNKRNRIFRCRQKGRSINGISSNRKIRFLYFEYNVAKERVYRHGGAYYVVSPFAMTWDDENYYMVAFDSAAGIIKHYRVDKMEKITVLDEERDGQDAYEALDMAVYARKTFGMFTGEEVKVHLRFENHLVGAVLDRLGRDVILVPDGEDHFTVSFDSMATL